MTLPCGEIVAHVRQKLVAVNITFVPYATRPGSINVVKLDAAVGLYWSLVVTLLSPPIEHPMAFIVHKLNQSYVTVSLDTGTPVV